MPTSFLKPALREFQPYVPGEQPADGSDWVKLNTNEAPWPPSPRVLEAVREAVAGSLRRYPDPLARAARRAVAEHHRLSEAQVALGNGGDELIEMCFRAFAGAGDRVAFPHPTYPLLEPLCRIHQCPAIQHPLAADGSLPAGFAADGAPLKFLVNPNSPTAAWLDREPVLEVVERSPGVVALDEAYADFAPEDRVDLVRDGHENLLILRTFSKSHALAGLRIGYALGHPGLIADLDLVKDSYNLDRLAIVAAVAAIGDRDYHDRLVSFVVAERGRLTDGLRRLGFEVPPSATNFLFTRPPASFEAAQVAARLRERRVLVRHFSLPSLAGCLRITVGTREQNRRLLEALGEVLGG